MNIGINIKFNINIGHPSFNHNDPFIKYCIGRTVLVKTETGAWYLLITDLVRTLVMMMMVMTVATTMMVKIILVTPVFWWKVHHWHCGGNDDIAALFFHTFNTYHRSLGKRNTVHAKSENIVKAKVKVKWKDLLDMQKL